MEREEPEKIYPWLGNFENTLSSPEGSKAFESYLVHHDSLSMLEFIWACDGMKNLVEENPAKADDLVTCIYKNYIISGFLPVLSNNVVMSIAKQFEAYFERLEPGDYTAAARAGTQPVNQLDLSIFDNAKTEVETYLENQLFPLFQEAVQKGEIYVGASSTSTSITHTGIKNGCQAEAASLVPPSSRLASHPDEFAKRLCEKLEDLMRSKDRKPP